MTVDIAGGIAVGRDVATTHRSLFRAARVLGLVVSLAYSGATYATRECDTVTLQYSPGMSLGASAEFMRLVVERCANEMRSADDSVDDYFRAVRHVLASKRIPNDWLRSGLDLPFVRLTIVTEGRKVVLSVGADDSGISPGWSPQGHDKHILDGVREIVRLTMKQAQMRFRFAPDK